MHGLGTCSVDRGPRWMHRIIVGFVFPLLLANVSAGSHIVRIQVSPDRIYLFGLNASQQINVTAVYADGSEEDVTRTAVFRVSTPDRASISHDGLLRAISPGYTLLSATAGKHEAAARVLVLDHTGRPRVDFERDVIPVLTMMGCNGSNCHGSMHGKSGFKLSQFGYEAQHDYEMIVEDAQARRVNLNEPKKSLLLGKPTFDVAHGGGKRFEKDSQQYQVLLDWLASGAPGPSQSLGTQIERLEAFPSGRVLRGPGAEQQMVVRAHYTDRTIEDVTHKVQYVSLDDAILQVNRDGLVRAAKPGEATILIRAPGATAAVRLGVRVPGNQALASFPSETNFIDGHVFKKLRRMNMQASGVSSDSVFIRRVYLDTLGILPSPAEVLRFLDDSQPHKRERLVNAVLDRPEYADFWGLMWADLLTVNSFKSGASSALQLDFWIRDQFRRTSPSIASLEP